MKQKTHTDFIKMNYGSGLGLDSVQQFVCLSCRCCCWPESDRVCYSLAPYKAAAPRDQPDLEAGHWGALGEGQRTWE